MTAVFMQEGQPIQSVTLKPGQADNGTVNGGVEPVVLRLTHTGNELFPTGFTVIVAVEGVPELEQRAAGVLTVRNELLQVVTVAAEPAFTNPGGTVNVKARVFNAVNVPQQALARYTVTNSGGTEVFTSTPVQFSLTVQSSLATVDLGGFNTTGLANGIYTIRVSLTDPSGNPLAGATGTGTVQVGLPVAATVTASPSSLPVGDGTVTSTLQITRNTTLPDTLTFFGQVQTTPTATTVTLYRDSSRNLAYVGGTNGIDILDISDPANPENEGTFGANLIVQGGGTSVRVTKINGQDHLIVGTQVASNANRFTILVFSLADPLNPTLVNGPTGTPINHVFASELLVRGDAFVVTTNGASGFFPRPITNQFGNVLSIDVSNPAAPVLTDVLFDNPGPPNSGPTRQSGGAIVDDQIAYIASSTSTGGNLQAGVGRILVVDYSNPTTLQQLREVQIPGTHSALTLAIQGNRALVVGSTGGLVDFVSPLAGNLTLSVLDITDRANPRLIGTTRITEGKFPGPSLGIAKLSILPLSNGLFAVSETLIDDKPVLLLVDPSNPDNILVTATPTANLLNEMAVAGNLLYTTSADGLTIYQIFGSVPVTALVEVPRGTGVEIVAGTFSTTPSQIIAGPNSDTLVWQLTAAAGELVNTITWQSRVNDLQTGESRPVTLGTTVGFANQGTSGTIQVPPTSVIGEHVIGLAPAARTVRPGAAAEYVITLANPTNSPVTYSLAVQGVAASWVTMPSTVTVGPRDNANVPLVLTSETFASLAESGFVVTATAAGVIDSVSGTITLAGAPDAEARGIVVSLTPSQLVAGQGTPARFVVRLTNTGSVADTFALTASGLPAGASVAFEFDEVELSPGASNSRDVAFILTPAPGTPPGALAFSIRAVSTT